MPLSTKDKTALQRAIRTLDRDSYKKIINRHFADTTPAQFNCEAIEAFYAHVVQMLSDAAPNLNIPAEDLTEGIGGLCGMVALRRALLEAFDSVCGALGELLEHSPLDWTIRYIRENLGGNVDMTMLANYSDLNYSYFSQLFKKRTGQNFSTYIHDLRMERAVELLQSGHKIQYITEMLGYTNPKNFSRAFRKHYGISPTRWRLIDMVGIHHKQGD